jgi:hypothetical protein
MPGPETAEPRTVRRELLFSLSPSNDATERQGDALLVKNVRLLAAGTWTDSAAKTPCEYSSAVLERYAANWTDLSLWSRHLGGVPRRITERIGTIERPRFEGDAIVGDLRLHGIAGTDSPGVIGMIEAGEAQFFSVEHSGSEKWNVGRRTYELLEFAGHGGAIVHRGACKTCTLPTRNNEDGEEPGQPAAACTTDDPTAEPPQSDPAGPDMTETGITAELAVTEGPTTEQVRALEAKIESLTTENAALKATAETGAETLRALAERVEKLEKTPAPKAAAPAEPARELAEPPRVTVDRRTGEVYGA